MHHGSAFVANEQTLEVVQPGEGAFDNPAHAAEPGAVRLPAAGDDGCDPAPAKLDQVVLVVVGAVGNDALGTLDADAPGDRGRRGRGRAAGSAAG